MIQGTTHRVQSSSFSFSPWPENHQVFMGEEKYIGNINKHFEFTLSLVGYKKESFTCPTFSRSSPS